MKILIRADASREIGSGHVMRCLTLARMLASRGAHIQFICRDLRGNLAQYIEGQGFKTHVTDDDISLIKRIRPPMVIVDHYGLDHIWQRKIRPYVKKIFVIDDLANRKHDGDILLDQNFYRGFEHRYDGLLPAPAKTYLGPSYALLRDEFRACQKDMPPYAERYKNGKILLFFGGMDKPGETAKALKGLESFYNSPHWHFDVVIGQENPHRGQLQDMITPITNMTLHVQTPHMAELMAGACLFIGAGGSVSLERLALTLPAVITSISDNQITSARDLQEQGAQIYLGNHQETSEQDYKRAITPLLGDINLLTSMVRSQDNLSVLGAGIEELINDILS